MLSSLLIETSNVTLMALQLQRQVMAEGRYGSWRRAHACGRGESRARNRAEQEQVSGGSGPQGREWKKTKYKKRRCNLLCNSSKKRCIDGVIDGYTGWQSKNSKMLTVESRCWVYEFSLYNSFNLPICLKILIMKCWKTWELEMWNENDMTEML